MGRPRTKCAQATAAAAQPPSSAPSLVEYRFAVPHTHAGVAYRIGDIIECDQAAADLIRRFAGDAALERVHGGAR